MGRLSEEEGSGFLLFLTINTTIAHLLQLHQLRGIACQRRTGLRRREHSELHSVILHVQQRLDRQHLQVRACS